MKKKIFWLIQYNQITPILAQFLGVLKTRLKEQLELIFIVPESDADTLENLKPLKPIAFKVMSRAAISSYQAYLAKKEALQENEFTQGLSFADTLLLDDLGGGSVQQTLVKIPKEKEVSGIILQIPTPLGSSDMEERIFQSTILWAKQNQIPALGYELLPLDTKWTLAPSLLDGVIARHYESYDHLKTQLAHNNIWLMPAYESCVFSSTSTNFHLNGVKSCYHNKNEHSIPAHRTILYLPHNVAMIYEYQQMIKILKPLGNRIHLMFATGKDQIRGFYSQKKMIEMIYTDELKHFASYSFHDMASPWEMMMADMVVACSACFNTEIAEKDIPCLIFDLQLPEMTRGNKKRVNTKKMLLNCIKELIELQSYKIELSDIIMMVAGMTKNR